MALALCREVSLEMSDYPYHPAACKDTQVAEAYGSVNTPRTSN